MNFVTFFVVWFNTALTLPLGASIEDYKYEPYAILYIDGQRYDDPNMYYEYEVNWTKFSHVNVNRVHSYRVDYRIWLPSIGRYHDHIITFTIIDDKAPVITSSMDTRVPVGQKTVDLLSTFRYEDNYDPKNDLKVDIIGQSAINLNVVGTYPITYRVTDLSGNMSEVNRNVIVYDSTSPTIEQKKEIILSPFTRFDVHQFFTFKDNYDKVVHIDLDDDQVNYQKLGSYKATLTASDLSNNTTSVVIDIKIVDNIAPYIRLKDSRMRVNLNYVLTDKDLLDYIVEVGDNYDQLNAGHVKLKNYVDTKKAGIYDVIYELTDSSDNTFTVTLKVEVGDFVAPVVIGPEVITLEVFSKNVHLIDYFSINDGVDSLADLDVKFIGKYDIERLGDYRLELQVTDKNKNQTTLFLKILVVDTTAPVVKQLEEIKIVDFKKTELNKYFHLSDNYDNKIEITIDDSLVDYNKVGTYPIIVKAVDLSGNEGIFETNVLVIDNGTPNIILTTDLVYVDVFGDTLVLRNYIKEITDNYDIIAISEVDIKSDINYNTIGRYTVTYSVKDSSELIGQSQLTVIVQDRIKPVIIASNSEIKHKKGKTFNIREYLRATDNYDGDITGNIKLAAGAFDVNTAGTYELLYTVTDASGNTGEVLVNLHVTASRINVMTLIPMVLIGLLAGYIGYGKYKQYKQKKEDQE